MRTQLQRVILAAFAALAMAAAVPSSASATGYWNMPSNCCQLTGYGCGAGYHACFMLGPIGCRGYCEHNEVRLPAPPRPPWSWYGCGYGSRCYQTPVCDPSAL